MTAKQLPSSELLRQLLCYEPETGNLFWRERENPENSNALNTWNKRWANSLALAYVDPSSGYKVGRLSGSRVYSHRIIAAIVWGYYPEEVDHINGDRADNRLLNLRSCSRSQNCKNLKLPSDNSSGHIGVGRKDKGWRARIFGIHLGTFENIDDAIAARKEAEAKYGFHPNHGRR
jgi:hypothetical protein